MTKQFVHTTLYLALFAASMAQASERHMTAIQYDHTGPASVLHSVELPVPIPAADEVLVKVAAAGVNSIDWELRESAPGEAPMTKPVVPGFDFSGTVVARGAQVAGHPIGEAVFAMLPLNTPRAYSEYVVVPATVLAKAPASLDALHAAGLPMVALTAWQALFEVGQLKAGQTVLIHGGAGGVGHMAVQLAKHAGARVIATASAGNLEFLRGLGADQVIDYRAQKFEDHVHGVDLVFDTVGGDTLERSYQVLRAGGTVVSIAGRPNQDAASRLGVRGRTLLVWPVAAQLEQIAALIDQGALSVQIDSVYPLENAAQAHLKSESRHVQGRLVLDVAGRAHFTSVGAAGSAR